MDQNSRAITWWIVIIVIIIIVIGGIWWYYASQPSNNGGTGYNSGQTLSSDKQVTSFAVTSLNPPVNGVIDQNTHSISLTVPKNTDLAKLTPTIQVSQNANVSPASGTQQDFTNPVTYTVTAQDGTTQDYTVTVKKATS